jgi:hypothetical protein
VPFRERLLSKQTVELVHGCWIAQTQADTAIDALRERERARARERGMGREGVRERQAHTHTHTAGVSAH